MKNSTNDRATEVGTSGTDKATCAASGCSTCGTELKSGMKYQNVCTTCDPTYNNWCGGCQRRLWDCMCIKPHTWE